MALAWDSHERPRRGGNLLGAVMMGAVVDRKTSLLYHASREWEEGELCTGDQLAEI